MIRSLLSVLFALAVCANAARAQESALARRVMEGIKLSLGKLDTVVGHARFTYAHTGTKASPHRVAFWFKKPFQIVMRETSDSFQLAHYDGRVTLYFPRELDVLQFDTSDSDAGVVRRMLGLLEVQNFASGFGLDEVTQHFKVDVVERPGGFEAEIVPHANGVWRRVLGLHRITVQIARDTYLPLRIRVYQRLRPPAPPALAFDMELDGLKTNVLVAGAEFKIALPAKVNQLGTAELVQFILGSSVKDGKDMLQGVADELTDRLKKLSTNPWDF